MRSACTMAALILLAASAPGCGTGTLDPPGTIGTGDAAVDPGDPMDAARMAISPDGGPQKDPLGPTVNITVPAAMDSVGGATMTITATIVAAPKSYVVSDSVIASIPGTSHTAKLSVTAALNTYSGLIDVSDIPSGPIAVDVVAVDDMKHRGGARVVLTHDAGPQIVVLDPMSTTYRGSAPVQLRVTDALYPVNKPTCTLQMVNVDLTQADPMNPAIWSGSINFHDNVFKEALTGKQLLRVSASNSHNTITSIDVPFTVDEEGPIIVIDKPTAGAFVGGVIDIDVEISDQSGVLGKSVVAIFGGDPNFQVPLTAAPMNHFVGRYDTRQLPPQFVLPILSVRAADNLANQSEQDEEIIIDNVPPAIELDPPDDQRVFRIDMMRNVCSRAFDPLGTDAVNDGEVIEQLATIRARVEDRGNVAKGQTWRFWSGVDPATVKMFMIPAADKGWGPLVVDTDGDGYCDDINPQLQPTSMTIGTSQALAVSLTAIPPAGTGDFRAEQVPLFGACDSMGDPMVMMPPLPLCAPPSPLTIDLSYGSDRQPAIYSIGKPVQGNGLCHGNQFDSGNTKVADGKAICVAVVAIDKAGNRNVSRPIRLCLDSKGQGNVCPRTFVQHQVPQQPGAPGLPDCTGVYDKATKMVNGFDFDGKSKCTPAVRYNDGTRPTPFARPSPIYQLF